MIQLNTLSMQQYRFLRDTLLDKTKTITTA